jgi:hypothetical protein
MTIEVGDKVRKRTSNSDTEYDVLYIHKKDERRYVVFAFKGDIPQALHESSLVKVEPVKTGWINVYSGAQHDSRALADSIAIPISTTVDERVAVLRVETRGGVSKAFLEPL